MDQIVLNFKEFIVKLKDTKQKILICGHPNSIKKVKEIIDNHKDKFKDYEFEYHSPSELSLVEEGQLYMMPYDDTNIGKFMNILKEMEEDL